jgi:DNA polymerase III epsilon subunit-like protein
VTPAPLAFVDTETTGLDPERHEVWEAALILRADDGTETEREWQLPVDLGRADAIALQVGHYYERFDKNHAPFGSTTREFAHEFAELTHGAHLVGAVPSFDDAFLKRLLRANGACPGWHYHLVDVEALALGYLAGQGENRGPLALHPPWKSDDLTRALGINPEAFEKHTALGDARWARAIYDHVMSGAEATKEDTAA